MYQPLLRRERVIDYFYGHQHKKLKLKTWVPQNDAGGFYVAA